MLGEGAFEGDAHALALVYRDIKQPLELRIDATKAAIPYENPRLAAIDAKLDARLTRR